MSELKEISRTNINTMRFLVEAALKVSRVKVIVNGIDEVPDKSVVFVSNHFTRVETILLPYIIYTRLGIIPRSLTASSVFNALPKDFMESVGSISVDHPNRDNLAVKSLVSGESWIIFPEGRMVKDKDVVDDKRFIIHDGEKTLLRPPHTGAAALALKAQMAVRVMNDFLDEYGLAAIFDLERLRELEVNIVPVNITYYPLRATETMLSRQMERLIRFFEKGKVSSRVEEELRVETSLFSPGVEITVNFGKPKKVSKYAAWLNLRDVYPVSGGKHAKVFRGAIFAMMEDFMTEIYKLTTVNPDHLAARILYDMAEGGVFEDSLENIRRKVYLASLAVRDLPHIFRQKTIDDNPEFLVITGGGSIDNFFEMGMAEGLLDIDDGRFIINEKNFKWPQKFNSVRLLNTIQVINNELEPLSKVTDIVDRTIKIKGKKLIDRTVKSLVTGEEERYLRDYTQFYVKGESKGRKFGMPNFHYGSKELGVLLIHGYMASPEEMRPLMEYLEKAGLTVYSVRLLGHGTSPYDLLTRRWEDWFHSVKVGYTVLSTIVDKVFVCGFSLGGALAWHLTAQAPPKLSGIISISAAMKLVNRASMLAPTVNFVDRMMKFVGFEKIRMDFVKNNPENPHINYFKNPIHGLDQLLELVKIVKDELKKITVPALILQGGNDPTVDPESAEEYYNSISSDIKGLVVVDSPYHGIVYRGDDKIFGRIVDFVHNTEEATKDIPKLED